MKNKLYLLSIIAVIFALSLKPNVAKADHCAGGELIYEWIGDSSYRFIFKFYRDCTGIDAYANQQLCIYNTCTASLINVTMNKWTGPLPGNRQNGDPVAAGCSGYPTRCESTSSTIPGYREWWYSCTYTLPFQCNYWRFGVSVSARNFSNNIPGGFLYLETTFDNTTHPGVSPFQGNSSPYFSIKPVPYVCINQPASYNNGAIDPNGDSLATDLLNPRSGGLCDGSAANLTYNPASPAYSLPNNPIQTNNTWVTNPTTGNMTFTPSQFGPGTITVRTKEFRNGVLIGSIMRDVQIQVLNCSSVVPTISPVTSTITGGAYLSNRVNGCAGLTLNFCYDVVSTDKQAVLILDDNHDYSIPNAIVTYTNQKKDSIRGCLTWTPSVTDTGLRSLVVTVKDSTCRPPGILLYHTFTLPIYIWPATRTVPDTSVCPGQTAYLTAVGGGNYTWSVLPGGSPVTSLSCTSCTSPVATPLLKTSYVVTSTVNSFCPNNKDTVMVDVLPSLKFTPLKDTITCPDNPVILDLKPNPPPGVSYTYKFTPSTYLDDSTKSAPKTTPKKSITYTVVLTSNANQCKGFDTVFVDVLTGFKILNPDTAVCQGSQVQVRATGDTRYSFNWKSTGLPGAFNNLNILTPIITPIGIGTNTYTLVAKYGQCKDDSTSLKIDLQPIPTVTVDNDASMCFGDTMQLHSTVLPANYPFTLLWTPGAQLDDPNIPNPIFKANQTNTLTLTASTSAGCSGSDDVKLTVYPAKFLTASNDTSICPGDKVQLHVIGNGVKTFRWYPDIRISDVTSFNPTVSPAVTQTYMATASDTNSCNDTIKVKVIVHPKGLIELPDSVRIYPGESYQMEPGGNCTYFSWFPPIGLSSATISNPVAKPEVNTLYNVTARTEAGCTANAKVNVFVSIESILDVPNAFAPGSDNGVFKILRRGDATLKTFSVFNRWGQKVFETTDINKGWDGTFKGDAQPMGVYVYMVEAVTTTGRVFSKQGNVTLVR
ncbi:MAG: gliding motility-associated C-terminal domain-containing protein [Bacteroidetes bacterium]|nr:gliding motility-associated C-terminal domain-containing protein [Bacteroidota bacterium]